MIRTLFVALILVFPALADMTIRYTMELKPSPFLPPQAVETTKQAMGDMFDKGMIYSFKENGASYMKFGPTVIIFDPATRMNTNLLIEKKVYSLSEPGKMDAMNADAMETFKKMTDGGGFKVSTDKTGNTRKIGDYQAEESVVKMEMSLKGLMPAGQPQQPGAPTSMKMNISMWFPTANESETKPLLKKYVELRQLGMMVNDPMQQMAKMFGQNPQVAAQMQTLVQEQSKGGLMLSMEEAIIMPGMAKMMAVTQGKKPEDVGEDEPMMTVIMSLKEFTEGDVQDSLFKVPEGFKEVKPEEMAKMMADAQRERLQPKKPEAKKDEEKN